MFYVTENTMCFFVVQWSLPFNSHRTRFVHMASLEIKLFAFLDSRVC
jgi:hypothetical protein